MNITVPLRKHKNIKVQKKHQELIFKEIQYNTIFDSIKQQEQLKKTNGFKPFKHKFTSSTTQNFKTTQNSFRKTQKSLKRASSTSQNFNCHRPTVSSFCLTSKPNHSLFKTTGYFFSQNIFPPQEQLIHEKTSEPSAQTVAQKDNDTTQKQIKNQREDKPNYNVADPKCQKSRINTQQNGTRKNVTLLDLKVKNIEQIIKIAGKSQNLDFGLEVQKDRKAVAKSYWDNFYVDMAKNSGKKSLKVEEKIRTLRKVATSHQKRRNLEPQNPVQELFLQKRIEKASKSESTSLAISPRDKKSHHTTSLYSKCNPLESQKIWQYYNFIRGFKEEDDYCKKMSLGSYRQAVSKYYILKNSEQVVKESGEYKKITMESLKSHTPEDITFFIYLNENQYKFHTRKNQVYLKEVLP